MPNSSRAARTPQFAALKKMLANKGATDPQPIASQTPHWTRRHFLQTASVGATAALCSGGLSMFASAAMAPKVVVVGAGLAGLNTAYQLKKAGIHAEVYEADGRTGGRVLTLKNILGPGLTTNMGGVFINSSHTEMLNLAKELEVELFDYEDEEEELGEEISFIGGQQYTGEQIWNALLPFLSRITLDAGNAFSNSAAAVHFDKLSIIDYMEQIGIDGWLKAYLDVLFMMEMGLACEEQSALTFMAQLAFNAADETAMFDTHDERYFAKDGAQSIPDAIAAQLDNQIHLSHALESVRSVGRGFVLNFLGSNGAAKAVKADIVVLAMPFSVLRNITLQVELPPLKKQAIAELGYGTNSKIVAGFKEKLWRKQGFYGDVMTDKPFQCTWDNTAFQPSETGGGLTFFFGGQAGFDLVENLDVPSLLSDLDLIFPDISQVYNGRHMFSAWPKSNLSLGSYSCYKPQQWTTFGKEVGKPVGNLFFAGEHCSVDYNGFMQGAVDSGHRVADQIVAMVTRGNQLRSNT